MFGKLLEKLYVGIGADLSDLRTDMGGTGAIIEEAFRDVDKHLINIGNGLADLGSILTVGVTTPLLGLGGILLGTAAEMEGLERSFKNSFKGMSNDVGKWADDQGEALNKSEFDLKEYLVSLNRVLDPLDLSAEKSAKFSQSLTQMALDVAAFNNEADADVVNDFAEAIGGNSDALEDYGFNLSDAVLELELYRLGQKDGIKAASEAELAQARLNAILSQNSEVTGEAARAAGDLSNQIPAMKAQVHELAVEFGQELIPMMSGVADWILDLLKGFNNMEDGLKKDIVQIGLIVAAIGPLLIVGGKMIVFLVSATKAIMAARVAMVAWAASMNLALGPIGLVIAAVGLLVAAYIKWGGASNAARRAHKDLYDLIDESKGLREQDVAQTEEGIEAQLKAARAIRETIKAKLEEKKLLLESQKDRALALSRHPSGSKGGADLGAIRRLQITQEAIKDTQKELADQDTYMRGLAEQQLALFLDTEEAKAKAAEDAAARRMLADEMAADAKTKSEKEAAQKALEAADKLERDLEAKAQKRHEDALKRVNGQIDANKELTVALSISNREYEVTAEMLSILESGFKGTAKEAKELAEKVVATKEGLEDIRDLQESDELVESIQEQIDANYELAEAARISTHELQVQETVMQLLRQGFKGSAADARKLAEELIASQNALTEAKKNAEKTAKEGAKDLKDEIGGIGTELKGVFEGVFDSINVDGGIKQLGERLLESLLKHIVNGALKIFGAEVDKEGQSIFDSLGELFGGGGSGGSSGGGGIGGFFKSLFGGGSDKGGSGLSDKQQGQADASNAIVKFGEMAHDLIMLFTGSVKGPGTYEEYLEKNGIDRGPGFEVMVESNEMFDVKVKKLAAGAAVPISAAAAQSTSTKMYETQVGNARRDLSRG